VPILDKDHINQIQKNQILSIQKETVYQEEISKYWIRKILPKKLLQIHPKVRMIAKNWFLKKQNIN
jgi:hypothetical protein